MQNSRIIAHNMSIILLKMKEFVAIVHRFDIISII